MNDLKPVTICTNCKHMFMFDIYVRPPFHCCGLHPLEGKIDCYVTGRVRYESESEGSNKWCGLERCCVINKNGECEEFEQKQSMTITKYLKQCIKKLFRN